jgi:rhodanese-related sulfurtransferase
MGQYLEFFHHHTELFAALAVVVIVLIINEVHGSVTGGKRLSSAEAVRLINDRDALVVDLRPAADFRKGHLLNAVNLPNTKLGERSSELGKDKERPLILCCASGATSVEAAKTLRQLGFSEVYPLRGGLQAWIAENLPVTAK